MKFSLPYVNGIVDIAKKYKDDIHDIYFTDGVLNSGRNEIEKEEYKSLFQDLETLKELGIKRNFLLNSLMINKPTDKIKSDINDVINHLNNIDAYYDIITTNNLMVFFNEDFKKIIQHKEVKCSINNGINDIQRLFELNKIYNFKYINIDRSLNRNEIQLKKIITQIQVNNQIPVILVNEGCQFNCIMKDYCDLSIADKNQNTDFNCFNFYLENNPANYFKSPILFYDNIKNFENIIIKISGRFEPIQKIENRFLYYKYGYNMLFRDLIDKPMFQYQDLYELTTDILNESFTYKFSDCKNECFKCKYCDTLLEKIK